MTAPRTEKIVIIGSGPAAWTAAIYAARANLEPLVFEGEPIGTMLPGGQLMTTTDVENFPGFPDGVTGPELVEKVKQQALRFGTRAAFEQIERVDLSRHPFALTSSSGETVHALTVVVATGANAKWLGLSNEERLAMHGGGVSACAVCDAALPIYRGKVIAVVGGGDTAMEEALYTTKFSSQTVIIHRRDTFRASRIMAERVLGHPKIRVLWNTRVIDILGDDHIHALHLEDTVTGTRSELSVGGLFIAIGHRPNTEFLQGQLELTPSGYVRVQSWRTATSVPGVFAAGDVMDDFYRQAITASATGCMAALEAERWLAHHGLGESPVLETAEAPVGEM
ncbi:MAG TPA: thioredoxin-disulfide reductase [Gemmatimonadaceae bacterium]|nr:thioredoxin-disulfide reductase [Gemmatimonadaceae bacterium]